MGIVKTGMENKRIFTHAVMDSFHVSTQDGIIFQGEEVWLDLTDKIIPLEENDESGLLSFAFHPYREEVFIFSSRPNSDMYEEKIISSCVNPEYMDVVSSLPIINNVPQVDQEIVWLAIPRNTRYHHGGKLLFVGDQLYISVGDGGPQKDPFNHAQDLTCVFGKILRIIPGIEGEYYLPDDNPFLEEDLPFLESYTSALPEIYAYGLRNPWSMHLSGDTIFIGDVGYESWESIFILSPGANYGWNILEGNHYTPWAGDDEIEDYQPPIFVYPHWKNKTSISDEIYPPGTNVSAVMGGYYVNGGYYLGDMSGCIMRIKEDTNQDWYLDAIWHLKPGTQIYGWSRDETSLYLITHDKEGSKVVEFHET